MPTALKKDVGEKMVTVMPEITLGLLDEFLKWMNAA